ncbi:MAG: OmpA family protein [Flavobacteriales bacterium]|jgi:outer membrane protein OmpA-like peptidoglycan-associated protein/tetratricopeptide (TPR) repeat protein|nr:MAG: OmpA family protein [Flavobacteriales bacterium]
MNMRGYLYSALAVLAAAGAQAQEQPGDKRMQDLLKRAERAEREGSAQFVHAETLYEAALALAPDDAEANMRMGLCQLNGPHRHKALPFLEKAAQVNPGIPRLQFLLGYALQLNARWDDAVAAFQRHKAQNPFQDPDPLYNTADKHIAECRNGKALMAAPVRAEVTNMGEAINTEQADYGAVMTADGSLLLFTSRRPSEPAAKVNKVNGDYFEDVYVTRRGDMGWGPAQRLPEPVNTPGNDASVGLFNDGRTMLIYRDQDGTGDLYECTRRGDAWSAPQPLGDNINTPHHESSAWYSFDRQWLYFVSERPDDNVGGQDIYRSRWDAAAGQWGPAENLGPTVNTIHDEEGVFVHPDGRTLYFSSKGHSTMGGYDVFRTRLENGRWTKPENMGWPVNSPDDDLFFVLTADNRHGYLSSFRSSGHGEDDLYQVEFLPDAPMGEPVASAGGAPVMTAAPTTVLVKGRIRSLQFINGMEADVELMDLTDASLVARFRSDAATGEYMAAVPGGRDYALFIKAEGHLVHSERITVPEGGGALRMDMDVELEPLKSGSSTTLRNLFFATASAELEAASKAELDQLVQLMRANGALRLQIAGHTDSDGAEAFNQKLSEARAQAVRDHLVAQGVDAARLVAVGYGATSPVAPNDTDANKALNRRTELTVL